MEAPEFDATLKDLETRLDRLKALYEMYFQGIERMEQGDHDNAYHLLKGAIRADPGYLNAYNTLAVLYRHAGLVPRAEQVLRRLLALDIDDHIDPTTREWITVDENGTSASLSITSAVASGLLK